jgi:hypothetical protein
MFTDLLGAQHDVREPQSVLGPHQDVRNALSILLALALHP